MYGRLLDYRRTNERQNELVDYLKPRSYVALVEATVLAQIIHYFHFVDISDYFHSQLNLSDSHF